MIWIIKIIFYFIAKRDAMDSLYLYRGRDGVIRKEKLKTITINRR